MNGPTSRSGFRGGHIAALDGLRGVAVLGVVAHHLGHLTGGYLGVDAFFVLSGFLITGLLLDESARSSTRWGIDLGRFWIRRAKRLLPALALLLVVVVVVEQTVIDDGVDGLTLRAEVLAAAFYVFNWQAIGSDVDYWATFAATSPLRHMWSLAIEEQFYLLWPLVMAGIVVWCRRTGRRLPATVAMVAIVGAAASITTALLFDASSDSLRIYYGTDTRVAAIFFGAVAAVAVRRWPTTTRRARRALEVVGLAMLVPIGVAWVALDGTSELLYRGGLIATGLATTVVVAAVVLTPGSLLDRALSLAPLRWFGSISYGLYLWHWPIIVWCTPERTGLDGVALFGLRTALSIAATLISYWLVEQPIRRAEPSGRRTLLAAVPALAVVTAAALVAGAGTGVTVTERPAAGAQDTTPIPPPPMNADPVTATSDGTTVTVDDDGPMPVERLIVFGDSGAFFLGPALDEALPDATVVQRGQVGCGLLTVGGGVITDDGFLPDVPDCEQWPERWAADVEAFRPTHALIVFSWPGIGDREIDGVPVHPCDPDFDRAYGEQVEQAVGIAGSTGAEVWVATNPYYVGPGAGALIRERTACLNDVMRTMSQETNARIVGLDVWLCGADECLTEIDGVTLRPDGLHFEGAGATLAAEWILGEIMTRE